jgi:hypothetical protein
MVLPSDTGVQNLYGVTVCDFAVEWGPTAVNI